MAPEQQQQQQGPAPLEINTQDMFTEMDIMLEGSNAPMDTSTGLTTDDLISELDMIQAEREAEAAGSGGAAIASEDAAATSTSNGGFLHPVPCRPRNPAKRDSIMAHVFRL
jgi:hypothetical protein